MLVRDVSRRPNCSPRLRAAFAEPLHSKYLPRNEKNNNAKTRLEYWCIYSCGRNTRIYNHSYHARVYAYYDEYNIRVLLVNDLKFTKIHYFRHNNVGIIS